MFLPFTYSEIHNTYINTKPPVLFLLSQQRMDTKLSELQEKINEAQAPLPLFTCLHVKPDVSELKFAGKRAHIYISIQTVGQLKH